MKNKTKLKIAAVSAAFGFIMLIGTDSLVRMGNPAQWHVAAVSIIAIGVAIFTICTID
jgi:hypothetical protein